MKSLNKYRKKKIMIESKSSPSKQTETNLKKYNIKIFRVNKGIDKIGKLLEGVADGYYDISALEKKKCLK